MTLPSYNPLPTTNAAGTFFASIAGFLLDDPGLRYQLQSAIVNPASANLIYGGVAVTTKLANQAAVSALLGKTLDLATAIANLTGFATFSQSYAGVQLPQSQVPLYAPGMAINFVEIGSGARIALPISSVNANALLGQDNAQLSWDYTNQVVIPFTGAGANAGAIPGTGAGGLAKIIDIAVGNSKIVVPNSPVAGEANWNDAGSVIVLQI